MCSPENASLTILLPNVRKKHMKLVMDNRAVQKVGGHQWCSSAEHLLEPHTKSSWYSRLASMFYMFDERSGLGGLGEI
jgi:hypothetical protein